MNQNDAIAAAIFALGVTGGVICTAIVKNERIRELKSELSTEKKITEIWKRSYKSAMGVMTLPQLLKMLEKTNIDQQFLNITKNF